MTAMGWFIFMIAVLAALHVVLEVLALRGPRERLVSPKTGRRASVEVDAFRVPRGRRGLQVRVRPVAFSPSPSPGATGHAPAEAHVGQAA